MRLLKEVKFWTQFLLRTNVWIVASNWGTRFAVQVGYGEGL